MALVRGGITVKAHVQAFANACKASTGADNYGTYNGHSPPEGPTQALDIFNPDSAAGYALQDRICAYAMANAKRFGVRYVIRRRQIWNIERADEGWRNQSVTGNRTADHYDHVHITFYATAADVGPVPDVPSTRELAEMDFTYTYNGEDWVFSASLPYFGKLPFGATLDGLKHHKLLHNIGGADADFHKGIVALAASVNYTGIR